MCEHINFLFVNFLISSFNNEGVQHHTNDRPKSVFRGVAVTPYYSKLIEIIREVEISD